MVSTNFDYFTLGDVYNVGMSLVKGLVRHVVVKFPFIEKGIYITVVS